MAGFGQNDEVVSPKVKTFGANDEVVPSGENDAKEVPASQTQVLTHPPTTMDRISSEVNGGGSILDPQKIVEGVGNSLGRTTQAWGDMFSGHANPHTLAEMVPLVGPAAVDATQKMFTPGQRVEGMTDAAMMLAPGAKNIPEMIPEIPSSVRAIPSVSSGAVRGAVSGAFPVMEYGAHKFPLPASLAGAAAGHFAGSPFGPIGSEIGALVGGAAPIVRGAIQGGKEALNNFRANEILSSPVPPRLAGDVFSRESFNPMPLSREEGGNFAGVRLPSGRAVGPSPRVNEVFQPEVPDTQRIPLWRDIVTATEPKNTPNVPGRGQVAEGNFAGVRLPSGRAVGPSPRVNEVFSGGNQFRIPRLIDPATAKPASTSGETLPVTNSGIVRLGQTPAERIQTLSNSPEGTLGTRAEMMRQLRLSDIHGTTDPGNAAIIRRFESPEYTPRPDRTFIDPRESEIMAPKPVTVSPDKEYSIERSWARQFQPRQVR